MNTTQLLERVEERIREWGVLVQDTLETPSSFIAFGTRAGQRVVLKVVRQPGDEWRCGEVLDAFDGSATARVYEYVDGAVLLERLDPGTSLATLVFDGRDEEATEVIAEVIQRMSHPRESLEGFATVEDWGKGFQRYLATGDEQIPRALIEKGQTLYSELCASQRDIRLLHGDLQHYNILFDRERGWIAIDPKGVAGEIEYEIGASLRNPKETPELFASTDAVEERLKLYESKLKVDFRRVLEWGFAQAVLSAVWTVEDESILDGNNPSILLARAIYPLLR